MASPKYVYFFGEGKAEGNRKMKSALGGKGANLAEMTNLGIPVPPGFTISAEICQYFYDHGREYPPVLEKQIQSALEKLEKITGKKFGDSQNPLLVSVRSGAAVSMPGMMDTVLNLGLNSKTLKGLIGLSANPRFGWDSCRRFIQMFGNVVDGIEHEKFEHILEKKKKEKGVKQDTDLTVEDLKEIVAGYKKLYSIEKNRPFPEDPKEQLKRAIDAVFGSWNNLRAITYRKINKIDDSVVIGTAVNVQAMVFGNLGEDSGTGVAFTRNPSTGEKGFYGEYLMNAQGEDVVAGIRTPKTLSQMKDDNSRIYQELSVIFKKLEKHYQEMQDTEFTIEDGRLFLLQTRTGKRTAKAAVKIAVDMVSEKLIGQKEAILRVDPASLDQLLHPMLDPKQKGGFKVIARGLPASPGAVSGKAVFKAEEAVEQSEAGEKVVLIRTETSPEDIAG